MNSTEKSSTEPKLQRPGAGLPFIQMFLIKTWVEPVVSKRESAAECRTRYERTIDKIIQLVSTVPESARIKKVLIKPARGLEDSSRFWSLNEVLEHLLITSRGTEAIILSLSSGVAPDAVVEIANVKPGKVKNDLLAEFKEYAPGLMARIDQKTSEPGMNLNRNLKFRHPWFGRITARQWYWLLSTHQGLHYRQAKEIVKGL